MIEIVLGLQILIQQEANPAPQSAVEQAVEVSVPRRSDRVALTPSLVVFNPTAKRSPRVPSLKRRPVKEHDSGGGSRAIPFPEVSSAERAVMHETQSTARKHSSGNELGRAVPSPGQGEKIAALPQ